MRISVLCENTSSKVGCMAEWGLSLLIEVEGKQVLFDSGYSDVYLHNAKQLGIDLNQVDSIALSHFHSDHTRGLQFHNFQSRKQIICHPDVLKKLPKKDVVSLKRDFELKTTTTHLEFLPGVFYLGEIPRVTSFERGELEGDKMRDDSALAIKTQKGVIVISGCSHAGICNICEYAKSITELPLYAVIGGFHLFEKDQKVVESTIEYFREEKPEHLLPMHCVDFPTLSKFQTEFGIKKYSAGDVISLSIAEATSVTI